MQKEETQLQVPRLLSAIPRPITGHLEQHPTGANTQSWADAPQIPFRQTFNQRILACLKATTREVCSLKASIWKTTLAFVAENSKAFHPVPRLLPRHLGLCQRTRLTVSKSSNAERFGIKHFDVGTFNHLTEIHWHETNDSFPLAK